jgi:DNA-binding transcriptional regulator YhcF (GntR family)
VEAEKTLQVILHCLHTANPLTAARILEEYVQERIVQHEAGKLRLVREQMRKLAQAEPSCSPYGLEEESKLRRPGRE